NPHCVTIVPDLSAVDLFRLGPLIETHPAFPQKTNVQFAQVVDRAHVKARIWERGAGHTLASGSSSCAVVAACRDRDLVAAGATGLEIRGKLFGKSVTGITDEEVDRMKEIMERHGAHVASIGSPFGKCDMDNPAELEQHQRHLERMAQLAHAFGTPIIRGFALWKPDRGREAARPDLDAF